MEFSIARTKFLNHLDLLDRSKETLRGYKMDLILFERFLNERYGEFFEVNRITEDDIEGFLLSMKEKGLAPASRNRRLYTFRSFFKYCTKKGFCEKNIAVMVDIARLPFREREYLVEDDVLKITREIMSPVIRMVVGLLYYSGLRVTEALNLKIQDVRIAEGILKVRSGKGNKDRSVPICTKLGNLLVEFLQSGRIESDRGFFFATKRSGKVSAQYVNYEIHEAIENLGWSRTITAHSFRHSFASALIQKNVGVFHVQKLLGHADLRVTSRYCHANMEDLREAVRQL